MVFQVEPGGGGGAPAAADARGEGGALDGARGAAARGARAQPARPWAQQGGGAFLSNSGALGRDVLPDPREQCAEHFEPAAQLCGPTLRKFTKQK